MARSRDTGNDKLGGNVGMPRIEPGMNREPDTPTSPGGPEPDAPKKQRDDDAAILVRAKKRFERCMTGEGDNRKEGLEDDKMYNGQQWPSDVAATRNFDHRPCLTLNKFPTLVHQTTNDQRQNRPAINVSPVGDRGDPEAAKMYMGMIRHIERSSEADIAYDTAYESAVRKGWGYWRILTEYENAKSFDQTLVIRRIRNAYTVYLDPTCQEPEGADSRYGFITEMIPRSEFEEEYPEADAMQWRDAGVGDSLKNWIAQHEVRVAEYFEIEHEKRDLVMLENGHEGWKDELDPVVLKRFKVIAERQSFEPKVKWYKLTATEVLERRDWPGKWIPIVRVIGDEIDIEGKVYYSGMIRHARDAQRAYNYFRTSETEAVALAPKAPYIMAEGQQEGHEEQWKQANTRSYPYLLYKPLDVDSKPAPPPRRESMVQIPAGLVNAAREAAEDMMGTTGVRFDATPHERMYDESGRALRELRRAGDIGSFHFVDNLARALRQTGTILLDLIPKIYDRPRVMTILRDEGEQQILIDPGADKAVGEMKKPSTGKTIPIFNPTIGQYGVTVTIGPSYATKRVEAAESMMDFVRAVAPAAPQMVGGIVDLIAKNMDWPEGDQVAARLAKMLPPNLLTQDQKDVPPQVQALLQNMQQQLQQMGEERQKLIAALTNQEAERQIKRDKIETDFEAKLLAVVQKAEAAYSTHVGSQLKDLAEGVKMLRDQMNGAARTRDGEDA